MLPGVSFLTMTQVSGLVGLSFLAAWVGLATAALIVLAPPLPNITYWSGLGVCATTGIVVLILWSPRVTLWGKTLRLPSLRASGAIFFWAALDTAAAALALYILLPAGLTLSFPTVFAAYLVALGLGLISNAPGGLGAFELTLLMLLPNTAPELVLSTVLAFRIVYHILPAGLAIIAFARPGPAIAAAPTLHESNSAMAAYHLASAPQAEVGLFFQGHGLLLAPQGQSAGWLAFDLPHHLLGLGHPLATDDLPRALEHLEYTADHAAAVPVLYKSPARLALAARKRGYHALLISQEAVLNPQTYSQDGAGSRQLRRLLRKANQAGVQVKDASATPPLASMTNIATHWRHKNKGERGFSMGRFCAHYIARQRVFLAYQDTKLTGFITLHEGRYEWTLDLMRLGPGAPDGTAQKLVLLAIQTAADQGITRLSLACAPHFSDQFPLAVIRRLFDPNANGLRRFKEAFNPTWEPRYLCAKSRTDLLLSGLHIWRAVHKPPPLTSYSTHDDDDDYEFAFHSRD
jgi:phosphatidylglycerol lysyltransferase